MPVASVHEDVIKAVVAAVGALSLGGMQSRVIRRMAKAGSWQTGVPAGDFIVVSGFGQIRPVESEDDNADFTLAYPFSVACVYRTTKEWDARDEDAQMANTQKLIDAFVNRGLALTYAGASCGRCVLAGGLTVQGLSEAFQEVMRELTFEAWVGQLYA